MTSPKLLPLYSHTSPLLWTSLKNGITCYKTDLLFFKMLMGIRKVKGISEQSGVFPFCFWVSQKCKTDENMVFKILFLFAYFMASLHGTARTVTRNRVRESGDDMQTSLWCSSLTRMKDMYSMFVLHLAYLRYQVGVMDLDPSSAKIKKRVCLCVCPIRTLSAVQCMFYSSPQPPGDPFSGGNQIQVTWEKWTVSLISQYLQKWF